ncbi:COMM domain-containing protein 5 [Patella vulgata]|uniref:COMM domain-containing protein 5 n=1 Tax=Patella vulgata TaxID=6465 RepID=UPI0024A94FD8|nr:COMM domain-containing protein 5 [Patella vulgata]
MSIIQVTGTGKSVAPDRTPFYGARVPSEIKSIIKPINKLDQDVFRKILKLIVASLEGNPVEYDDIKQLETNSLTEEILVVFFTGLTTLLKSALKHSTSSLKQEMFKDDLVELQIPKVFHDDLTSVVFGSRRPKIDSHSNDSRPRFARLENLKWRVDVAISTSVLNRVLEPSVQMEMTLSDGSIKTFEVPTSKFHELRYNVAFILKEMEDLEKRSILKIKD